MSVGVRHGTCHLPLTPHLEHGGALLGAHVAYEIQGPANAPAVLVLGGISANQHVAASPANRSPGWFDHLAGSGRAIDTNRFRVLGINFLVPDDHGAPPLSTTDHATAIRHLLDLLEINRLHAAVGASLGGMIGLQLGTTPRVDRVIAISAADRPDPRASAWRSIQRDIVRELQSAEQPRRGLELARALAMTSYRTAAELAGRFDGPTTVVDGVARAPVQDYLEARGAAFAEEFSAPRFLALSQSLDLHRVDPAELRAPITLLGVRSDSLVRIDQLRALKQAIARAGRTACTLHEFDSRFGHVAFLKEGPILAPWVRAALERAPATIASEGVER